MNRLISIAAGGMALAVMGLAQMATAAAPPLEAYARPSRIAFMSLSASGAQYAYLTRDGSEQRIQIVSTGAEKPVAVELGAANKVSGMEWAGEDHILVFIDVTEGTGVLAHASGPEMDEVLVVSTKDGSHYVVFDGHRETLPIVRGYFGSAQIRGRWCAFFSSVTYSTGTGASFGGNGLGDLYRVDLDSGGIYRVAVGNQATDYNWLLDPDGQIVAQSRYDESTGAWSLTQGQTGILLDAGYSRYGAPAILGLGRQPGTILTGTDHVRGRQFQQVSLSGAAPSSRSEDDEMSRPLFDRRSGLMIGEFLGAEAPRTVLFAPERQARLEAVRRVFAKYDVRLVSYDADFSHMIVKTTGADDAGTFWLADMSRHTATSIALANPDFKTDDIAPVRSVAWTSGDGMILQGVLTLPPGRPAQDLPVVVLAHDGPQGHDEVDFNWWAQAMASRGYAVFQPNYRGSNGGSAAILNAGRGEWGRRMQTDLSEGLSALAQRGLVDPKRACIAGAGYGGYAALAGVTVQHGLYRCAIAVAPVSDLKAMLHYQDESPAYAGDPGMQNWQVIMGAQSADDPRLDAISPVKLANQADAPVLLVHSRDDLAVPHLQSVSMRDALIRSSKPVESVEIPNDDHALARSDTRLNLLTSAIYFLQKYNPAD
jgi:dipeptidyl aminopeptidase/acylaminoacyl peptidase